MTRKRLTWILIAILIVVWGINENNQDAKEEAAQAKVEEKLSKQLAAESKQRLDNISYGVYLSSTCDLKGKLQPVSEILQNISKRKAIPSDLIPELELFNEEAKYIASDGRLFKDSRKNPTTEELQTDIELKKFANELNLKTAELKQGMVTPSDSYFSTLRSEVERIVQPVCDLAEIVSPSKKTLPTPLPSATKSKIPGSMDTIMEEISRKVSYDSVCKLYASSRSLSQEVVNAQTSKAFKPAVLDSAKKLIDDLGYASFSFREGSLYTASPEERSFSSKFSNFKTKLENSRYNYWVASAKSSLEAIDSLSRELEAVGNSGCEVVEGLEKK